MERRKEDRKPAEGKVYIRLTDQINVEFEGRLLDTSDSGFRVVHNYRELSSGEAVTFRHQSATGTARAMWKRILPDSPDSIETGFMILRKD